VVDVTSSTKERGRCDIEHVGERSGWAIDHAGRAPGAPNGLLAGAPSANEISMMMGQKAPYGVPFDPSSSDFGVGWS
jgi:hypothetical protein